MSNALNVDVGLKGRYTLILRDKNGNIKEELSFDNLITNYGLEQIVSGSFSIHNILIGTGTTEPSVTDLAMSSLLASSFTSGLNFSAVLNKTTEPYWVEQKTAKTFNPGVGTGVITEVGVANSIHANKVLSRSLIKDNDGNPTSITKLADDFLDVIYVVRSYIPNEDTPFTAVINGVEKTGIIRPLGLNHASQRKWSPVTSLPNSSSITQSSYSTPSSLPEIHSGAEPSGTRAYLSGCSDTANLSEYKRRYTLSWNPDKGNITIKSIYLTTYWSTEIMLYGIEFDEPIEKTASQRFKLSFDIAVSRG